MFLHCPCKDRNRVHIKLHENLFIVKESNQSIYIYFVLFLFEKQTHVVEGLRGRTTSCVSTRGYKIIMINNFSILPIR